MRRGEVIKGDGWALVTGGGSGIGLCIAHRLADLGYNLVIVGDTTPKIERATKELHAQHGVVVHPLIIDLARLTASEELYNAVHALDIEIDVLVNNAGIFSFCDLLSTPVERIERIIMLHDMTTTLNCRRFAEDMVRRSSHGYILNLSSFSMWMPFPGLALYGASKAFLRTFSVAFAKEVHEHGIRVTAVCPAGVATNLYGLTSRWQRIGRSFGVLITPDTCARRALNAMWRGQRTLVPDWWNRLWIPLCKTLPMCVIRPIRKFTMKFQK